MGNNRLDYSELVKALQENKMGKANKLLAHILPRLKEYLAVTMNAAEQDAEESIHRAFLNVYERILEGKLKEGKYIFSYLMRACRHEYIRYARDQHRFNIPLDDNPGFLADPAEQIENLLDKDRQRILEECLQELEPKARKFIELFIDKPDITTEEASKYFELSGGNIRTRKSRILSRLHHCFKFKWEKEE